MPSHAIQIGTAKIQNGRAMRMQQAADAASAFDCFCFRACWEAQALDMCISLCLYCSACARKVDPEIYIDLQPV